MNQRIYVTLFALILCGLTLLVPGAKAAEIIPVTDQSATANKADDLRQLVGTLENDASRQELIKQLKLLLDAEEAKKQSINPAADLSAPLTEQLGVRKLFGHAINEYEDFLNRYAISSSVAHQILGTVFSILLTFGLYFGVRRMAAAILRRVDRLSERIGLRLSRLGLYTNVLQLTLKILILGIAIYTLGKIWDLTVIDHMFESAWMRRLISTFITFVLVAFLAAFIWEAVGMYLSYVLKQADDQNQTRVQTLLPIVRNIILSVFALLFGLILLSELGINVGPLIAGAGVIGVAIGFGAQSMVKDFITGFTIVLEDLIRVGDVATLGGASGTVERITLRKVQLRDVAGNVYTIPYSQITTIQNQTKDFSFYVMDISVGYAMDTDQVTKIMQKIDDGMRSDTEHGPCILAPIEIFGVDRFADSAIIIKARIRTVAAKQWAVGREYNRRLKIAFEKEGIEIPFPQRMITIKNA